MTFRLVLSKNYASS